MKHLSLVALGNGISRRQRKWIETGANEGKFSRCWIIIALLIDIQSIRCSSQTMAQYQNAHNHTWQIMSLKKKEKNETINFRNSCSVVLIRRHVLSFGFLWQANPCDKENGENEDNLNWYCNYKCVLPFTCSTSDRIVPCLFNVTSQWSNGNISSNLSGSYLSCNCLQLLDILVHSHLLASPWW